MNEKIKELAEKACEINSHKMTGNTYGSGNKGKPKSDEHKRKIAESIRARYNKD